jgi:F0F1-type ATP synthase beta subunit
MTTSAPSLAPAKSKSSLAADVRRRSITGLEGKYVRLKTLSAASAKSSKAIRRSSGTGLYMVGTIDEVLAKAEKMKAGV